MATKHARRRNRAPRHRPSAPAVAASGAVPGGGWRWRTFPVFFALCLGLLIASIINGRPSNTAAAATQIAALLGVVYGIIHMIVRNIVRSGHARFPALAARGRRRARVEDDLVYPDDEPDAR